MLTQSDHIGAIHCLGQAERHLKALALAYANEGDRPTAQKAGLLRLEVRYIAGYFELETELDIEGPYVVAQLTELVDALAVHADTTFRLLPGAIPAGEVGAIREMLRDARGPLAAALAVKAGPCAV